MVGSRSSVAKFCMFQKSKRESESTSFHITSHISEKNVLDLESYSLPSGYTIYHIFKYKRFMWEKFESVTNFSIGLKYRFLRQKKHTNINKLLERFCERESKTNARKKVYDVEYMQFLEIGVSKNATLKILYYLGHE